MPHPPTQPTLALVKKRLKLTPTKKWTARLTWHKLTPSSTTSTTSQRLTPTQMLAVNPAVKEVLPPVPNPAAMLAVPLEVMPAPMLAPMLAQPANPAVMLAPAPTLALPPAVTLAPQVAAAADQAVDLSLVKAVDALHRLPMRMSTAFPRSMQTLRPTKN
jgi:hypothetical protein